MSVKTGNRRTLPALLSQRVECKNSNGTVRGTERYVGSGRLAPEYRAEIMAALDAGRLVYVVYSYATPIAWVETSAQGTPVWIMPQTKYSATTTNHQSMVRQAARNLVTL